MTPYPEDSQITAHVLGELNAEESAAIEQAATTDPTIREKIAEAQNIQHFLKTRLSPPRNQLHPQQRENVRRNASIPASKQISILRRFPSWLVPLTAAAVVTLVTFILVRKSQVEPASVVTSSQTPAPPVEKILEEPAPPPLPPAPIQATIANSGFLSAVEFPALDLPILPGKPNLSSLIQPIREAGHLPPHDAVRIEEILNSFPLRLNGTTAIARSSASNWHPDKRDDGINSHLATLSTEMIACPWKPSATLLLVFARINNQKDCNLKVTFRPNAENVVRYRLLGFNPGNDTAPINLPAQLEAGAYTTLAIEIESSKLGSELGSLLWSTDGVASPPIPLIHKADAEPSDDARFATLVCTYGQWLAGEYVGIIDKQILSALVRENTSSTIPADQVELIKLIEDSLQIQNH